MGMHFSQNYYTAGTKTQTPSNLSLKKRAKCSFNFGAKLCRLPTDYCSRCQTEPDSFLVGVMLPPLHSPNALPFIPRFQNALAHLTRTAVNAAATDPNFVTMPQSPNHQLFEPLFRFPKKKKNPSSNLLDKCCNFIGVKGILTFSHVPRSRKEHGVFFSLLP